MQTIEILPDSTTSQLLYRATCGDRHATGQTPGQALDILESQLDLNGNLGETLVILQRFRADDLFSQAQKERLRDLMDQYHAAIAQGIKLDDDLQTELENLVEAEMEATIERSKRLLVLQGANKPPLEQLIC